VVTWVGLNRLVSEFSVTRVTDKGGLGPSTLTRIHRSIRRYKLSMHDTNWLDDGRNRTNEPNHGNTSYFISR
jgi:hypothetical protein